MPHVKHSQSIKCSVLLHGPCFFRTVFKYQVMSFRTGFYFHWWY